MSPSDRIAANLVLDCASHLLEAQVRLDQLIAARRNLVIALPVNTLLGVICALVAWRSGEHTQAALWLLATSAVNAGRGVLELRMQAELVAGRVGSLDEVDRHLGTLWKVTLLSGCIWAMLPGLCAFYTAPQSVFFLVVQCGITAGAIAQGGAYARIPIAFNTPVLLSAIVAMIFVGGFHRYALAVTMIIYLAALVATGRRAEVAFTNVRRLTHSVSAANVSLRAANGKALALAEEMRHRANHDALTNLLNRAGFLREAERYLHDQCQVACLMLLDLDGFKAINDAFGHHVGDEMLIEVSNRLRQTLPPRILLSRWGGDEFAVLYCVDRAAPAPARLANQLIAAVGAPFSAFGTAARIGLSIGVHVAGNLDLSELLSCADFALYAAKETGRNRCHVFDDRLRQQLEMRRDVERDLPTALTDKSVEVWFQPIFGEAGATLCSLEALVRWRHPAHGWIAPADLMATAAKAGLARPLLECILDQVCAMLDAVRHRGRGPVRVAMNISPREMLQLPIDEIVLGALFSHGLSPSALEIEITEETALDSVQSKRKFATLSQAGVQVTIDDFGVGYSSFASLRKLNIHRIKIDRCFVSGLGEAGGDRVIVEAILKLGDSLGVEVIAEGVECAEDLRILQALGCQFMQGYHLCRPMPRERCLVFLGIAPLDAGSSTARGVG